MKIWAAISQKGGAGKTSCLIQLGVYATQCGERVIILDMDTQNSSVGWSKIRGEGTMPVVIVCLQGKLGTALEAIEKSGAFTLVLIDTAPHTDRKAVEAIRPAEKILCPARPSKLDLMAFGQTAELLDLAGAKDRAIGVVNQVYPGKGAPKSYAAAAGQMRAHGIAVAENFICSRQAFIHATDAGKGITETEPKSDAAREVMNLWGELSGTWPLVEVGQQELKV